jgi:DNA integrity scanning protein DisA with diadenylate cyclase activity
MRGRQLDEVDDSVLRGLASLDGATVVDGQGRLIAAGAILMHPPEDIGYAWVSEGARTTAALAASRYGPVLKVSTDGVITCYDTRKLWEI